MDFPILAHEGVNADVSAVFKNGIVLYFFNLVNTDLMIPLFLVNK